MRILAILLFAALMSSAATAEPDYLYRGTFTVEVPPRGDAPDWVYRAWLGLTLPYREAAAWWKAHDYPRSESFCFPDQALLF
jgi:hypothetical protein